MKGLGAQQRGRWAAVMNRRSLLVLVSFLAMPCIAQEHYQSVLACPVTIGSNSLGSPFPDPANWYGSESLAVILPDDGKWGITGATARIAVKLFIWSVGFKPGMEKNLTVRVESLSGGPNDAVVKDVTNAGLDSGWTMLAGIDFPSAGCWRLTLDYLGQSLSFVVETIDWTSENTAT
jgi:hypothetical protein